MARTCKKRIGRGRRALRWELLICAALLGLFLLLEKNLEDVILDLAHARAEAMAVEYIHEAVRGVMGETVSYEDMILVRTDGQGRITMLQANAVRMNELATAAAMQAQSRLVIPSSAREVSLSSQVLIAESIIVGSVPDSFVQVPEMDGALNFAAP